MLKSNNDTKNIVLVVAIILMTWVSYRIAVCVIKKIIPVRPYVPTHVADVGVSTSITMSPVYSQQVLKIRRPNSPPKQDDMV